VGHYSARELGYQALGWAPTSVVLTTGVGLLMGIQVLTAQMIGEGRRAEAGAVLQRGLILSVLVGAAVTLVLLFAARPLLAMMDFEPGLAPGAAAVVETLAWSMTPYLVSVAASFWLEALERPLPGMYLMVVANLVNLALNLWLVPGSNPFGVEGAVASAWTTLFSRAVYALSLIVVIVYWDEARALGVFAWRRAGSFHDYWGRMLRIGSASAVSYFVESTGFAAMTVIAGLVGATAVAAYSVVFNIAALVFMVPLGLSSATAVFVGKAYGGGNRAGVRRAGFEGMGFTVLLLTAVALAVAVQPGLIAGFYTGDPTLLAVAVPALLMLCLFFPLDGLQVIAASALRASGDEWMPTLTHAISYNVVMLPAGYHLAITQGLGVMGLILTMIGVSILAGAFLLSRFLWVTRRGGAVPAPA
ncbi:MAG TPA: MATE family efflux transporter, partial [Paracoccaceae bacterium]|nr:MATE family efflux transporter [Paracoccaceae bacterium]